MNSQDEKPFVLTIDGPAGAGKSTVAKKVAEVIGLPYLDTGAIYRAIAWWLNDNGVAPEEEEALAKALSEISIEAANGAVAVNGRDVTAEIRTAQTDKIVSPYAALASVREALLSIQRGQAKDGLVADGRDMGTVVFPEADLKIFLTASSDERAARRYRERIARGEEADYDEILAQVKARDEYDINRKVSPLRPAQGAIILDTTTMGFDEVVGVIVSLAAEFGAQKKS